MVGHRLVVMNLVLQSCSLAYNKVGFESTALTEIKLVDSITRWLIHRLSLS